jgi:hypothetical protein
VNSAGRLRREIADLRSQLLALAREERIARLRFRYALELLPPTPLSAWRKARVAFGRWLRQLGLRRVPLPPWLAALQHSGRDEGARTLLIWALGTDRDTLRAACQGLERGLASRPALAPVLVTDVADFAFFSRLGWLVEYVPTLAAPATQYARRKQRYLAWRYRDAPALPVSCGLVAEATLSVLLADM